VIVKNCHNPPLMWYPVVYNKQVLEETPMSQPTYPCSTITEPVRAEFSLPDWNRIHKALVDYNIQRENKLISGNAGDTEFREVDHLGGIIKDIENYILPTHL
jgi:hypothetical protein